jgi:uncharacterized membrane protein YhhN
MNQPIVYIYCIDLLVELAAIIFKLESVRIISKPLLMILLILGVAASKIRPTAFKYLLLAALFFSWLGDLFLLFDEAHSLYFIGGLLSFLIAHLFYIILFVKMKTILNPRSTINKRAVFFLLLYVGILFVLLYPKLGALKIPVILYALVLASMLIASLYACSLSKRWQNACIIGALLFLLSDSILALNKFQNPFPTASFLIMLTYGLAQLFIVLGVSNSLSSVE